MSTFDKTAILISCVACYSVLKKVFLLDLLRIWIKELQMEVHAL